MKKIIPFKKDIIFKTHIAEITSISLEHSLHIEGDNLITGEFIVSGEYKISDTSTNTEVFNFNLPFDIHMDERYILDDCNVDIYDFYYEIINDNILAIHIEVSVNNFKEKSLIEEHKRETEDILKEEEAVRNEVDALIDAIDEVKMEEERDMASSEVVATVAAVESDSSLTNAVNEVATEEVAPVSKESVAVADKLNSIFPDTMNQGETYTTYKVYIVRENDSIETVMQQYSVTREELDLYNNLREINIGDKLIIPCPSSYAKD